MTYFRAIRTIIGPKCLSAVSGMGSGVATLANVNTFFVSTDYLSDRELYVHLWEETLREINVVMPTEAGFNCTYDLVSGGSDEDIHAWLKYYADEESRQQWAKDFPNEIIPPHEDVPYDRDRHLPQHPRESDDRRS